MGSITPHPAVRELQTLTGEWEAWAEFGGERSGPVPTRVGWLEDGAFLVVRADIAPDAIVAEEVRPYLPFPTTMVIGYDDTAAEFTALYADARGVARVYGMSFGGGEWRMWRAAPGFHQRFIAVLSDDGREISGRWEASEDGETWRIDFPVTYTKTG